MDNVYVWDYAIQIPLWVVLPLVLVLGWAAWKLAMWMLAFFR
jgi:hypothetical protein